MVYVLLALEAGVWRSVYSCLWKPCANRACAILEELLHYREVFTSTKRTMYSCFPHLDVLHSKWMACTACTAAAATSPLLPQFCLYPPPPSSNLSASHSHTHTDVHIAHGKIYTHQPQSGPAGPVFICILICMFWNGSTLQSFDGKGFHIISASPLRTFPHMCRRRASMFAIMHRLSALRSACIEAYF